MNTTQVKTKLPQCWQDLQDTLENGVDRVILFGPSGIGKTYAGMHIGNVEAGAFRLVCTEDMTNMEVTGSFMPDGKGGFNWLNGSALKAWEGNGVNGGRLIVDEIDKASGDVMQHFSPCLIHLSRLRGSIQVLGEFISLRLGSVQL